MSPRWTRSADSARKRVLEEIPGLLGETSRSRLRGAFVVSAVTERREAVNLVPLKCLETHRSIQRGCRWRVSFSSAQRNSSEDERPLSLDSLVLAPSFHVFRPSKADVTDDPFQVFELSLVTCPSSCEREAVAVGMPLTGAPLREEECFVLDAGTACTSGVVVALRLPRRSVHLSGPFSGGRPGS